jgi:hypothetical protein
MSLIQTLVSYGLVEVRNEKEICDIALYLFQNQFSFKVVFDMNGVATFFLIEPEDQK